MNNCQRSRGFTLIEMMITVALLAIIATIATPSFKQLLEDNRVGTQTSAFITAINTARTEAIRRGEGVWLTAVDGDFAGGWCIRADAEDCDAATDLFIHPALDSRINVGFANGASTVDSFAFNRLGGLVDPEQATTMLIGQDGCTASHCNRSIGINAIGHTSVTRGS